MKYSEFLQNQRGPIKKSRSLRLQEQWSQVLEMGIMGPGSLVQQAQGTLEFRALSLSKAQGDPVPSVEQNDMIQQLMNCLLTNILSGQYI